MALTTTMGTNKVNHGRNIRRIREIFDMKQEVLADKLGWSQQKMSTIEQKESLEPEILEQVAKALGIPPEAIEKFSDEATIWNIQHNYEGANASSGTIGNNLNYHYCTFNTIDKLVELYERMLKEKDEIIEKLQQEKQGRK